MTPTKRKAATCPFPVKCNPEHIELLCPDCQHERQRQHKKKRAGEFKRTRKAIGAVKGLKPARDADYRQFIREHDCLLCFMGIWELSFILLRREAGIVMSECCHVGKTGKGMRQKCNDYETIPMCQSHHREQHGPNGATFFERHPIELSDVFGRLRAAYEAQR